MTVDAIDAAGLDALLRARWTCRAYLPQPVPGDVIDRMLALAQRSASWCNTQPWTVHITTGESTERFRRSLLDYMREHRDEFRPDYPMPGEYTGIHRERRRASGWQLYSALGIERGDRESSARQSFRNFELFGAPHVAIISVAAEQNTYGVLDAGIYVGTLLLAAQALGLGATPQAALARVAPFLRDYFHIDESQKVLLAVSFGYPDLRHPANSYRTDRAPLDEVVTFVND